MRIRAALQRCLVLPPPPTQPPTQPPTWQMEAISALLISRSTSSARFMAEVQACSTGGQ